MQPSPDLGGENEKETSTKVVHSCNHSDLFEGKSIYKRMFRGTPILGKHQTCIYTVYS